MDIAAARAIAIARKQGYLATYPIAVRPDWDVLKFAEEAGEVAEAYSAWGEITPIDRGAALLELADEMADLVGFVCILAESTGAHLGEPPARSMLGAAAAARHVARDVGRTIKAYNRLTGQSRPTGRPQEILRDEMADALSGVLASLDEMALACGINLPAAFDAKWGLDGMPSCNPAATAGGPR